MPLQRILQPDKGSLEPGMVTLDAVFTMGASGAVSAASGKGFTTSSWTDNGVGDFTVALPGVGTLDLRAVTLTIEDASQDLVCVLKTVSEANRTVNFKVMDLATPSAADPTSGAKVRLTVRHKESSAA